jgi:hypothetical protein
MCTSMYIQYVSDSHFLYCQSKCCTAFVNCMLLFPFNLLTSSSHDASTYSEMFVSSQCLIFRDCITGNWSWLFVIFLSPEIMLKNPVSCKLVCKIWNLQQCVESAWWPITSVALTVRFVSRDWCWVRTELLPCRYWHWVAYWNSLFGT